MSEFKKILLINPVPYRKSWDRNENLPWNLLFLAAQLVDNYAVKIIDGAILTDFIPKCIEQARDSFLVGFSVMTNNVEMAYNSSKAIRKQFNVPIVWGGVHPTLLPEQTLECEFIDYIIHGEGDLPLFNLAKSLEKGLSIEEIKGLGYKRNGKIIINERERRIDLNKMPMIPDDIINFEDYVNFRFPLDKKSVRSMPVYTSRGCPYKCTFCANIILSNQDYRTLSAENTLKILLYFIKKYKIEYLRFRDDNLFKDRNKVAAILDGIISKGLELQWSASCRVNYFRENYVDDELLSIMAKSGCRILYMGAESGSDKVLERLKKGITIEMTLRAARACNQYNIVPYFSFMVGLPGETKEELYATVNMMKKIKQICPKAYFVGKPAVFKPFPGGILYDECIRNGWLRKCKKLEDWFSPYIIDLFNNDRKIPWSHYPGLSKSIQIYTGIAFENIDFFGRGLFTIIILKLFKKVATFRVQHNFYILPIDRAVFEFLRDRYIDLEKIYYKCISRYPFQRHTNCALKGIIK